MVLKADTRRKIAEKVVEKLMPDVDEKINAVNTKIVKKMQEIVVASIPEEVKAAWLNPVLTEYINSCTRVVLVFPDGRRMSVTMPSPVPAKFCATNNTVRVPDGDHELEDMEKEVKALRQNKSDFFTIVEATLRNFKTTGAARASFPELAEFLPEDTTSSASATTRDGIPVVSVEAGREFLRSILERREGA